MDEHHDSTHDVHPKTRSIEALDELARIRETVRRRVGVLGDLDLDGMRDERDAELLGERAIPDESES